VENGLTGLLSPPRSPGLLAANLCLLLGDKNLSEKLAEAGRRSVQGFSWERSADLLEALICKVSARQKNQKEEKERAVIAD